MRYGLKNLYRNTLNIYHKDKRFFTKTENNLLLKKDLLPTLKEVYQSFQLQTYKVYKKRLKRRVLAKIQRIAALVVLVIPSGRCTSFCVTQFKKPIHVEYAGYFSCFTIQFSATLRLSAPVHHSKLKLLFDLTRSWRLSGVNGFFIQSRLF